MAGKKDKKNEVQAPEGFDVDLARRDADGWVARVPGNVVTARILGRREYRRKDGKLEGYYQLELLAPCMGYPNKSEEDDSDELTPAQEMPAGSVLNLAEHKALEDLRGAIEAMSRGAVVDVWTGYVRKDPNRSSQGTHWVFYGPKLRYVKQPRAETPIG